MRKYTTAQAKQQTGEIVELFREYTEFPGRYEMGLNPDNENDKATADAIHCAISAAKKQGPQAENTAAYGYLMALVAFGIVEIERIRQVNQLMISKSYL